MALFNRGIVGEIVAAREALAGSDHTADVIRTLGLIGRLADQLSPRDLLATDDESENALSALRSSYGFARLSQITR